jgi:hypothetical protein
VESIQKQAQQAYCELDALAVEQLLQRNVVNMKQHWHELALGIAEIAPSCLTELSVASPLLSYFMHGTIRNAVDVRQVSSRSLATLSMLHRNTLPPPCVCTGHLHRSTLVHRVCTRLWTAPAYAALQVATDVCTQVVSMPPRVLFGSNSNDPTRRSSSDKVSDVPISRGHPCLHMTLEAADPKSPIRAARTFFLTRAAPVRDLFAGKHIKVCRVCGVASHWQQAQPDSCCYSLQPPCANAEGDSAGARSSGSSSQPLQCNPASSHDLQHLTQLYAALVAAAQVAMRVFATQVSLR